MNAPVNFEKTRLFDAINSFVEHAAATRETLAIDTAINTFLSQFPDSGVSESELREHLSQLAVGRQVTIAFGC